MSRLLDIPQECQEVFRLFAGAVVERPEDFAESFTILLKYSSNPMLRLLESSEAQDLAYTILGYLPETTRDYVAERLANNERERQHVLQAIAQCQDVLRETIKAEIAKGNMPVAQLMRAG